jgi:hypothetical protein
MFTLTLAWDVSMDILVYFLVVIFAYRMSRKMFKQAYTCPSHWDPLKLFPPHTLTPIFMNKMLALSKCWSINSKHLISQNLFKTDLRPRIFVHKYRSKTFWPWSVRRSECVWLALDVIVKAWELGLSDRLRDLSGLKLFPPHTLRLDLGLWFFGAIDDQYTQDFVKFTCENNMISLVGSRCGQNQMWAKKKNY